MKKYILGAVLSLGLLVLPAFVPQAEAASLGATQISAIIGLLQAFGADQSVINTVLASLSGVTSSSTSGSTVGGTPSVYNKLPPTGITAYSDATTNTAAASVADDTGAFPRQDARYARPFDYTKIANDGSILPATAALGTGTKDWACTKDNSTGLVWEVKTTSGLRSKDNTYSWFNSTTASNGGATGIPSLGVCQSTGRCDTEKFVADVEATALCGYSDWRVPTIKELESLSKFDVLSPSIDVGYFPNTAVGAHWSSTPSIEQGSNAQYYAYIINTQNGWAGVNLRAWSSAVRLVRGTPLVYHQFTITDNGTTVSDTATGLMWKRAPETTTKTWQGALLASVQDRTAGYSDWRLPNVKELRSLVDESRELPAIDITMFPNTTSSNFWSSSPSVQFAGNTDAAWVVDFGSGGDYAASTRTMTYPVRLVRDTTLPPASGTSPTASFSVNGQPSATNVDPLVSRTWSWSSTNGSTYATSAVISGCETASQNGTTSNWTPWTDGGSGTAASGSTSAIPGAVKYGCTITATYKVTNTAGQTATANATVTFKHANSSANTYTLSLASNNTTNISVLSLSPSPSSAGTGGYLYASGTSVTVAETPTSGYTFAGWSGACSGTAPTCTVLMSADKSVTANFTQSSGIANYNLTITKNGSGGGVLNIPGSPISSDATSKTYVYPKDMTVTITASPDTGSVISSWSGCDSRWSSSSSCVFIMSADKSVTATFSSTQQSTSAPTASFSINGQPSATNVDPLVSRTWSWSSTNGSSYTSSAVISGCETASQNGTVSNWTPWTGGLGTITSGTATSGSTAMVPGSVKYGCAIVASYTVTSSAGQSATANATVTFKHANSTVVTPPSVTISCTGTHPSAGNGVVLSDYTPVVTSPSGPSNTVWQYGAGSCGWSCTAPMLQDGNVGCKNPTAGSGTTVTVNTLSATGQKVSGATVTAVTVFGLGSSFPALGSGGSPGTFTTDTTGTTPEFWFQQGPSGSWTTIGVQISGYKIRSAVGCTLQVLVNGGKQYNYCVNAVNGTPVTINLVPGDISTTPTTVFPKSTFSAGESLTGTVVGGDPKNTWACMDSPNTIVGHECMSGWSDAWRQLTVPYGGQADGWQLVETNYGDTIQLSPLPTAGYPAGTYTQYVKTGQYGTVKTPTSFTLTAAQNTTTYPLTVTTSGTGIGGVRTASNTINCGAGGIYCSANAYSNTSVTLTETPNAGSTFTGWSGACSGIGTTCTVTMSQAQVVTATFN